jgi:hypothetical protein
MTFNYSPPMQTLGFAYFKALDILLGDSQCRLITSLSNLAGICGELLTAHVERFSAAAHDYCIT